MLAEQPGSSLREEMRFLLANAQFAQGKYDEAKKAYGQYQTEFPQGAHTEEAFYRVALTNLFAGNYDDALKGVDAYLKKLPVRQFRQRREVPARRLPVRDEQIQRCHRRNEGLAQTISRRPTDG